MVCQVGFQESRLSAGMHRSSIGVKKITLFYLYMWILVTVPLCQAQMEDGFAASEATACTSKSCASQQHDAMEGFDINDLWTFFLDCDSHLDGQRPIPTTETWNYLRNQYMRLRGNESMPEYWITGPHDGGFRVSYVIKQSNVSGRGIYAAQDIKRGDLVYMTSRYLAEFTTGRQYRLFLQSLPRTMACDVLMWSYIEDSSAITVELAEGSLFNDGYGDRNIDCGTENYALRDIRNGEELLCDYAEFALDEWYRFGL